MFDGTWSQEHWVHIIMILVSVLLSITVHEFAHAKMADFLGDDTPRRQGRISLNPLDHLDPIGTLGIIAILFTGYGFGWGKPVIHNPLNNTKTTLRLGKWLVTAAGPASNLVIAVVLGLLLRFNAFAFDPLFTEKWAFITLNVNVGLMLFNLIPVPPLDGSKLILPLLNNRVADNLERQYAVWGIIPLAVLVLLRIPQMLLDTPIRAFTHFLTGY